MQASAFLSRFVAGWFLITWESSFECSSCENRTDLRQCLWSACRLPCTSSAPCPSACVYARLCICASICVSWFCCIWCGGVQHVRRYSACPYMHRAKSRTPVVEGSLIDSHMARCQHLHSRTNGNTKRTHVLCAKAAVAKLDLVPHALHVEEVVGIIGILGKQRHCRLRVCSAVRQEHEPRTHGIQKPVQTEPNVNKNLQAQGCLWYV